MIWGLVVMKIDKITLIWYITMCYTLLAVICGSCFPITGNEMFYSLLTFYIGLPIVSLIGGYLHANTCSWFLFGQYICVICFIAFALPVAVFQNMWEEVIVVSVISTLVGALVGYRSIKK